MRIALDTNVVASALLWHGPPRLLLRAAREKRIRLYTSPPLLLELADVLARPKFERKLAAAQWSVDHLVEGYASLAIVVHPSAVARISSDPDDDVVLATATAAAADWLVSGDRHLLDLKSDERYLCAARIGGLEKRHAAPG